MTVAALYVDPAVRHRPRIDAVVRYRGEVGTVRWLIEPDPGWLRCFVAFDGYDQFVDDDDLCILPVVAGGGA